MNKIHLDTVIHYTVPRKRLSLQGVEFETDVFLP